MSQGRPPRSEYAVLTLISSTQAVRIVRKQSRWKTAVSASRTVFSENRSMTLENSSYCLGRKNAETSLSGDRETGAFYLEFLPGKQDTVRLVIRMTGKDGRQLLADADLYPFSPMLPGVFRASAKADWDGQELFFPPASTVALWQSGPALEMALPFGCTDSMSRLRYGFFFFFSHIYAVPANIMTNEAMMPLTDSLPLPTIDPLRGMIRFGRWSVLSGSEKVRLLGFTVDADQ